MKLYSSPVLSSRLELRSKHSGGPESPRSTHNHEAKIDRRSGSRRSSRPRSRTTDMSWSVYRSRRPRSFEPTNVATQGRTRPWASRSWPWAVVLLIGRCRWHVSRRAQRPHAPHALQGPPASSSAESSSGPFLCPNTRRLGDCRGQLNPSWPPSGWRNGTRHAVSGSHPGPRSALRLGCLAAF